MRRMNTQDSIIEAVNQGIEEGEIEVGGLPEIEAGDAGKVLMVNENEDGVEWGEAGGGSNIDGIITLDFGQYSTVDISDELYQQIADTTKNYIINVRNSVQSNQKYAGLYMKQTLNSPIYSHILGPVSDTTKKDLTAPLSVGKYVLRHLLKFTHQSNNTWRGSITDPSGSDFCIIQNVEWSNKFYKLFTKLSGNDSSGPNMALYAHFARLQYCEGDSASTYVYVPLHILYVTNAPYTIYAEGKSATYKYELVWNLTDGSYTITRTAL